MSESQSAPSSRPSKTNPADTEKRTLGPSDHESLKQPLTKRSDVALREEVEEFEDLQYAAPACSWREGVFRWQEYIKDKQDTSAVFENLYGDRVEGGDPHRFAPEYADKQYAKLKDLERGLRDEYGKRLHTAMLTLTASSTDESGNPLPPVDHLEGPEGLLASWSAVTRALRRAMDGKRYERLAILEPHESGYLHVHIAVFVDGVVSAEDFAPVIEAHLRNCGRAGEEAHDLADDSTVSVNHVGADRAEDTIGNLGTYLAEYLGAYGDEALEAPDHQQKANAVLWATGKRRWRPSRGAQEYMATNRGDDEGVSEWELVGMKDANGDVHEVAEGAGGVSRFTTDYTELGVDETDGEPPPKWGELSTDSRS